MPEAFGPIAARFDVERRQGQAAAHAPLGIRAGQRGDALAQWPLLLKGVVWTLGLTVIWTGASGTALDAP